MKRELYQAPAVEVEEIAMESVFAASGSLEEGDFGSEVGGDYEFGLFSVRKIFN